MVGLLVLVAGCTESNRHAKNDQGGAPPADGGGTLADGSAGLEAGAPADGASTDGPAPASGRISIFVKGDHSKVNFKDGLSGQTATDFKIAMSRYQVLRSATDPKPALCFDHGSKPAVADMKGDNLVGYCETKKLPTGVYTHGRTRVEWARYTVEGVYHSLGQKWKGKFTFFRAYSNVTYQGLPYSAGHGFISFSALPSIKIPFVYGPFPPVPGVKFDTIGGKLYMTFRYTKPLPIVKDDKGAHWARFNWKVGEAFRWKELKRGGYKTGTWDVSANLSSLEPVIVHGVSNYYITSSVD